MNIEITCITCKKKFLIHITWSITNDHYCSECSKDIEHLKRKIEKKFDLSEDEVELIYSNVRYNNPMKSKEYILKELLKDITWQ